MIWPDSIGGSTSWRANLAYLVGQSGKQTLKHYFVPDPNWRSHLVFPVVSGRQKDLDLPLIKKIHLTSGIQTYVRVREAVLLRRRVDGAGSLYSPMGTKQSA